MTQQQFETMLKNLMNATLSAEESNVLSVRYGLNQAAQSIKKAEISLGIPASKLRKIEKEALDKMVSSDEYDDVYDALDSEDINKFMTNGMSGYFLLAIQLLNH